MRSLCPGMQLDWYALTRRLSIVVDDRMEEVALICFIGITSHSALSQDILTGIRNTKSKYNNQFLVIMLHDIV